MKTIVLLFFISTALFSKSQSFTNGSVFNYEIGDTIQTIETWGSMWWPTPPTYVTKIFLSKNVSTSGDTIEYTYLTKRYTPAACQSCSPNFSQGTQTITIVGALDSFIHPNENDTCINTIHTYGTNTCGVYYSQIGPDYNNPSQTCFEATVTTNRYAEGLGLIYYHSSDPGDGFLNTIELKYFHKMNGAVCGTLLGLEGEIGSSNLIRLQSSLVHDRILLNGITGSFNYNIFDLAGNEIVSNKSNEAEIDIKNLFNGYYMLQIFDEDKPAFCVLKFVKF